MLVGLLDGALTIGVGESVGSSVVICSKKKKKITFIFVFLVYLLVRQLIQCHPFDR